jgi:hypothetical protein
MRITTREQAKAIADKVFCPECGSLREPTPTGGVCLAHRLLPGVTAEEIRLGPLAREILKLPRAKRRSKWRWQIGQREYVRVRLNPPRRAYKYSRIRRAIVREGKSLKVAYFRRVRKPVFLGLVG